MKAKTPNVTVYPDAAELVQGAAEIITEMALAAVKARGCFTIALAGGGTPQPIYALLAKPAFAKRIPWDKVHVFFGDERCVPPDDEQSNYRMAHEALLQHVPIPPENIHRIAGEDDPASAAEAYEQEMQKFFQSESPPACDLICLGLGDNGHTASLFPGTASLREQVRWVVPQYVEVMGAWRVTMTLPLINAARNVVFLVSGTDKADVLAKILTGPYEPDVLPAQMVRPTNGQTHWLVDVAAKDPKVLVIDVGGTYLKMKHSGDDEARRIDSGPNLTASEMVAAVQRATKDWQYHVIAMGYPGPIRHGKVAQNPHNLGAGWLNFDFSGAFGKPLKIMNDAAMQALGSYDSGVMLFLGLGTGLGSALVIDGHVHALELAHLPYKDGGTFEDYVGKAGLERLGIEKWRQEVANVVTILSAALEPSEVVIGGGNAKSLQGLPNNCRLGDNANGFKGGFRMWATSHGQG